MAVRSGARTPRRGRSPNAPFTSYPVYSAELMGTMFGDDGQAIPFTRGSTGTIYDFDNGIINCLSGEARFCGLKRVQNLYASTNMGTGWGTSGNATITTGQPDAVGQARAVKVVPNNGTSLTGNDGLGGITSSVQPDAIRIGDTVIVSIKAKPSGMRFLRIREDVSTGYRAKISLVDGSTSYENGAAGNTFTAGAVPLDGGWWLAWVVYTTTSTTHGYTFKPGSDTDVGDGSSGVFLCDPMCELVTHRAARHPSQFVSASELSSPYYGASVDRVQYRKTDYLGDSNIVYPSASSAGLSYNPNGVTRALTETDWNGVANGTGLYTLPLPASTINFSWSNSAPAKAGELIEFSFMIKRKDADPGQWSVYLGDSTSTGGYGNTFQFAGDRLAAVTTTGNPVIIAAGNGFWRVIHLVQITADCVNLNFVFNFPNVCAVGLGGFKVRRMSAEMMPAAPYLATTNQPVHTIVRGGSHTVHPTFAGHLEEEGRTNAIRNGSGTGGTAGSPGTMPTNWSLSGVISGLTRTLAFGYENGMPYTDIRLQGTPAAGTGFIVIDSTIGLIVAAQNNKVSHSVYAKLVAGSTVGITTIQLEWDVFDAVPTNLGAYQNTITLASTGRLSENRKMFTNTISQAGTTQAGSTSLNLVCNGAAIDITIRLAGFQLEKVNTGGGVTSPMFTTAGAFVRSPDQSQKSPLPSGWNGLNGWCSADFYIPYDQMVSNSYLIYPGTVALGIGGAFTTFCYDNATFADSGVANAVQTVYRGASSWGVGVSQSCVRNGAVASGLNKSFDGDMNFGASLYLGNSGGVNQINGLMRNVKLGGYKVPDQLLATMVN